MSNVNGDGEERRVPRSSSLKINSNGGGEMKNNNNNNKKGGLLGWWQTAAFKRWGVNDLINVVKFHPLPCFFLLTLFFFMGVEYTLHMVPPNSPPFDLGFISTRWFNRVLKSRPELNTILAGFNTVFVAMQMVYILWTFLIEGRARPGIAAMFMFTFRGILGYCTQLPLPKDYLGSGADFPVGNVSFFLFFSGHVAGAVISSLDMRRMQRNILAWIFDVLNVLQVVRLLGTRGHYSIDLGVGVGAGILFDTLAGNYEDSKRLPVGSPRSPCNVPYSPLK